MPDAQIIRKTIDQLNRIAAEQIDGNDLIVLHHVNAPAGQRDRAVTIQSLKTLFGLPISPHLNAIASAVDSARVGAFLRKKLDGTGIEFAEISATGAGGNEAIKVSFSYGDATPKAIALTNKTVFTAQIVVTVPFNGTNASLRLGDIDLIDRLMKSSQNNPYQACEYESNPSWSYVAETMILLSIVPGEGCTQGSGFVLLEIQ